MTHTFYPDPYSFAHLEWLVPFLAQIFPEEITKPFTVLEFYIASFIYELQTANDTKMAVTLQ